MRASSIAVLVLLLNLHVVLSWKLPTIRSDRRFRRQAAFTSSLYSDEDYVKELDADNFDRVVLNSTKAHLIQFYSAGCGHCRRFQPVFVEFSRSVRNWSDIVEVNVINCGDDRNRPACKSSNVYSVPTIKYFYKGIQVAAYANLVDAEPTAPELRRQLADHVIADYHRSKHTNWPKLDVLPDSAQIAELWTGIPADIQYLGIVFEKDPQSTEGSQLVLDLIGQSDWLEVRRATRYHSNILPPALRRNGNGGFPAVAVIKRDNTLVLQTDIRSTSLNDILQLNGRQVYLPPTSAPQRPVASPIAPSAGDQYFVSETDMLLAVWYSLYQEVSFSGSDLLGANFTALVNYLESLKKYWPQSPKAQWKLGYLQLPASLGLTRSQSARKVFEYLHRLLLQRRPRRISVEEWRTEFRKAEALYAHPFPKSSGWVHCKGTSPKYRGYSCGLWTVFHTLTVHAFLEDGMWEPVFNAQKPLRDIQGWIRHFFTCKYCADHFLELTEVTTPISTMVRAPSDVVLYLWQAHNDVNERLKGDATEDPAFPKLQFPSDTLCPSCSQNGAFEPDAVLRFMVQYYTNIRPHNDTREF